MKKLGPRIDLCGMRFGRLLVKTQGPYVYAGKQQRITFTCVCDCGVECVVKSYSLFSGRTKSCGCLVHESWESTGGTKLHRGKPVGATARYAFLKSYKRNAKTRGYAWEITNDYALSLAQKPCHYCGSEPASSWKGKYTHGEFIHNGLDRLDNSVGYVHGNVVPCCTFCNRAKNNSSLEDFEKWLAVLVANRSKKQLDKAA